MDVRASMHCEGKCAVTFSQNTFKKKYIKDLKGTHFLVFYMTIYIKD